MEATSIAAAAIGAPDRQHCNWRRPLLARRVHGDSAMEELHQTLNRFNHDRLRPRLTVAPDLDALIAHQRAEHGFVETERAAVAELAAQAPRDADGFVRWFERLRHDGAGQGDPLFPWLAKEADSKQMQWFLVQEVAGEAGFDDLVALSQLQLPVRAKLEMARNYWDEMGRGNAGGMHGPMLAAMAEKMALPTLPIVWEASALGNLMVALACNRHYAYQSIGALGVIELTAPGRAQRVNAGLMRLGVDAGVRRYYAIHATLDVAHSAAWNKEVLHPLVAENPAVATALAEGALMRLEAGKRCFERYRRELW